VLLFLLFSVDRSQDPLLKINLKEKIKTHRICSSKV